MGYDVRRHARRIRQMLGAVPQETALYEELSAWDNLDFHADLFGMPRKEKKARIMQMLELVQLQERKRSRVGTFSGGMKRRLALARALLHDPHLLYLDEPTLGVDVQSRRAIWDYILSLRDQGKTVLITTNYLEEAQALCERIAILDQGKLIAVDTPEHLKQTYGGSVVELETAQPSYGRGRHPCTFRRQGSRPGGNAHADHHTGGKRRRTPDHQPRHRARGTASDRRARTQPG